MEMYNPNPKKTYLKKVDTEAKKNGGKVIVTNQKQKQEHLVTN